MPWVFNDSKGNIKRSTVTTLARTMGQIASTSVFTHSSSGSWVQLTNANCGFATQFDSAGTICDATNGKLTAPVAGKYRVSAKITFNNNNTTNVRGMQVTKNTVSANTNVVAEASCSDLSGISVDLVISEVVTLAAGDVLAILIFQNTGTVTTGTGRPITFTLERVDEATQTLITSSNTTYRKNSSKVVNTTTSATDLLNGEITIPANVMGATGVLRLTAMGDYLNNSGGTTNGNRWQLVFGGTTIFDTGAPAWALANSASRLGWMIEAWITNTATNAQVCFFRLSMDALSSNDATAWNMTTGEGSILLNRGSSATSNATGVSYNTAAVDTTAAKALVLNVINPSASASYETKLVSALVEII